MLFLLERSHTKFQSFLCRNVCISSVRTDFFEAIKKKEEFYSYPIIIYFSYFSFTILKGTDSLE